MASSWGRCVVCCPCCPLAPPPIQMLLFQRAHILHRFASASICCVMPTQRCANLCETRESISWGCGLNFAGKVHWAFVMDAANGVLSVTCFALHRKCLFWVPAALFNYCRRMLPFMRVCSWQPLWVECLWLLSHLMVASTCCTTWPAPPMPGRGVYPIPPGVCAHMQDPAPPPSRVCLKGDNGLPKQCPVCDFLVLICFTDLAVLPNQSHDNKLFLIIMQCIVCF